MMAEVSEVRVNGYVCRHPSIFELARQYGTERSIEVIVRELARDKLSEADTLLRAIDEHWKPPPFNPILVAQTLGIRCVAVHDPDLDDAMLYIRDGNPIILYREGRTNARTRFNIFHEISHTLFPDYQSRLQYRSFRKRKLFEPDGSLEYLCDIAAAEMLMPMDLFRADLVRRGFGAAQVNYLCRRYGASTEAICLRMVESDIHSCAVAFFKRRRHRKKRNQKHLAFLPEALTHFTPDNDDRYMYAEYTVASERFRLNGMFLRKHLSVGEKSCISQAAQNGRLTSAEEIVEIGRGRSQRFFIEALPMRFRRRSGAVLAFFYTTPR